LDHEDFSDDFDDFSDDLPDGSSGDPDIELVEVKVEQATYVYDKEKQEYRTYIPQAKGWVRTSEEIHRLVVKWYSNWDGAPVSLNGVSRRTGLPRNWVVGYLKAHGITHDSAPFSAEEVARRGVEELAQDALALKFGAVATRTEELSAKETAIAARKWWEFETSILGKIREWIGDNEPNYTIPKLRLTRSERPYTLVTSATDFHWGMRSYREESGYEYNREIAAQRLKNSTEELINRLLNTGTPDKIILAVGSDWFHVDGPGPLPTTTKGTPQTVDGTPFEIMLTGAEICREHIDLLSQVAPVTVVLMSGNHDRSNAYALLLYLTALYEGSDRVDVIRNFRQRVYQRIGNTLACFTHGDGAKVKDLGPIMAKEARMDWGDTGHHVAFGGHLHHQRIQEIGGIRHYLLPSLAEPDAWHSAHGYVTSQPGLLGILVDHDDGPTGTLFCPVREGGT
jgi:predicted phosphodiesterase